jgi:hypothetical protein
LSKTAPQTTITTKSSSWSKTANTKSPNACGRSRTTRASSADAYRIGVGDSENNNDLHSSAYLNEDGSYVVVVLNPTYEKHSVSVNFGKCSGVKKVKAYLTDQDHDVEEVKVSWRRGVATAHITSRGLLTFKAS